MAVADDYAYIPSTWGAKVGHPDDDGVPTSYYAAVQFTCQAEIVDAPHDKAELLRRQLAHFQPAGRHAPVAAPANRHTAGCSPASAACGCTSTPSPPDSSTTTAILQHRTSIARRLDERALGRGKGAAAQQRRRLAERGQWQASRD